MTPVRTKFTKDTLPRWNVDTNLLALGNSLKKQLPIFTKRIFLYSC